MKVALLDRRFGAHGGRPPEKYYTLRHGAQWHHKDYRGSGNTFSFIDAFGEVMTAPLQVGVDFKPLKDYDLLYLRMRDPKCATATKELREQCSKPVIVGYCDELSNESMATCKKVGGGVFSWIKDASEHVDVIVSSFPEKYDRPKHEAMGVTNYESCPFAGDVFGWSQYRHKGIKKKNVVAGMMHLRSFMQGGFGDKVHSLTFNTMKQLQNAYGVECWFFLNFDGGRMRYIFEPYVSNLGLKVKLIDHQPNNVFETMMAEVKVFIEEHQDPCFSRASLVAAGVGTPQVGNDMNTVSNICFPETTVVHGDWGSLTNHAARLLTDESFYNRVREKSLDRAMENLYYPAFRDRMLKLYMKCLDKR